MSYQRILLKVSGEACADRESGRGLDPDAVHTIARQIANVARLGVETAVVVGGGNILRGAKVAGMGTLRASADYMGMLGTVINALAISDAVEQAGVETRVMTAIEISKVAEPFVRRRALAHLSKDRLVILAAGTGNPFFSTDTAAALRARELGCDVLLKGTKVDGVYSADPNKDKKAKRYDKLGYKEVLERDLGVMDAAAIALARENRIPILVFSIQNPGGFAEVMKGKGRHTLVAD